MNTSIVVCGEKFDIGTRVVLWNEDNGFNAYDNTTYQWKEQNRKTGKSVTRIVKGYRFSKRTWRRNPTLAQLQKVVTQFFLHHSGMYRSKGTFHVLHKERGLSCHFLLDDDGTIYQTLDLKWKAWHGGNCNPMAVGVEIDSRAVAGRFPNAYNASNRKKHNVQPRKKRYDNVQGKKIMGFEYNDDQYKSLICLGVGLVKAFPRIRTPGSDYIADFPRTSSGKIIKSIISKPKEHTGFICHYNASSHKIDPISFDHERFLKGVEDGAPDYSSTFVDLSTWLLRQKALAKVGYDPGPIDGIEGKKTRKAIKEFQSDNGLKVDGLWGPNTEAAMVLVLGM